MSFISKAPKSNSFSLVACNDYLFAMAYLENVQLLFRTYQVAGLSPVQGSKNSLRNSFPAANFSKISFKDHMRLAESALPVTLSSSMNTEADSYRYWQNSGRGCLWTKDINGLPTEGQWNWTARWSIRLGREGQSTEDTSQDPATFTLRSRKQAQNIAPIFSGSKLKIFRT